MVDGRRTPGALPVALSGTPGTGKSSVVPYLPRSWSAIEVGALGIELGTGEREGRNGVVVDLAATSRRVRRDPGPHRVLVGHLAHLLPVRRVILLRCHPVELARRLGRARRGTLEERSENAASEALDVILAECRRLRRKVVQIDTTGRSRAQVARAVIRAVRAGGRGRRSDAIDWLADPAVTDFLLRRAP